MYICLSNGGTFKGPSKLIDFTLIKQHRVNVLCLMELYQQGWTLTDWTFLPEGQDNFLGTGPQNLPLADLPLTCVVCCDSR